MSSLKIMEIWRIKDNVWCSPRKLGHPKHKNKMVKMVQTVKFGYV